MLGFLQRLFARPAPLAGTTATTRQQTTLDDFARTDLQVPMKAAEGVHSFVRRESILNRREQIAGYEFSLITPLKARTARRSGVAARAYDVALLTRLELHRAASLLGARLALICLSIESMDNEAIDRLPRGNTVLVFELGDQNHAWGHLASAFAGLREKGFRRGIRVSAAADAACPLIADADFVQVDVTAFDGIGLRELARKLKLACPDGRKPMNLLASSVQSDDDYRLCHKCGFDLFQGPFVAGQDGLPPTRSGVNRVAILSILNMLRTDQSFSAIAGELKNEPTLSYKLLRYLNSAAVGSQKRIDGLTEALVLLGRDKFYRWTSLLLFDFESPGYREQLLAERSLTRGRTLELLAGKGRVPNLPDQLFLIGLFSLLDQAMGRPLAELVDKAALPESVRDALLGRPGACTDALMLVTRAEADASTPADLLQQALEACGIDDRDLAPLAAQALAWASEIQGGAPVNPQ